MSETEIITFGCRLNAFESEVIRRAAAAGGLSDAIIKRLPLPEQGARISYDLDLPGFGIRITAADARSFVLIPPRNSTSPRSS